MTYATRRHDTQLSSVILALAMLILTACGGQLYHVVQRGETLYSIGWSYGYDYREIARWNDISPPYALKAGQRLRVAPPDNRRLATVSDRSGKSQTASRQAPSPAKPPSSSVAVIEKSPSQPTVEERNKQLEAKGLSLDSRVDPVWRWPTQNRQLLQTYSASDPARQGVDISGAEGAPVYAAADGYVVYAGSGLVRYGRLIIIKHNEKFLSAYAHNNALSVKEGEVVKAGQKIADMGRTGTTQPKLHFEIRQNGRPVDPLRYLPK